MRDFATSFYKSRTWQECRRAYAKSKGGLCEVCMSKGRFVPGEIVHHKVKLTADNINDPEVTLGWDNLQLVCRDCHADLHKGRETRYKIDELGRVIVK